MTDASAAAVPGAALTAIDEQTGLVRETTSAADGGFRFSSLPPGTYALRAQASGFQAVVVNGIALSIGGQVSQNITLSAAAVSEEVTVVAPAPLIEPTRGSVSDLVSREQVSELPLNSRDFAVLALLTPGVDLDDTEEEEQDAAGQIQFAAQPSRFTMFVVDGADTTTEGFGGNEVFISQDAIEEFRVIRANWPAEFGRTNAGIVQVLTKSGTNEVHGTAFGYFRDKALNARGKFEDEKPEFERQQFGGTVGGPLRRDRTHYFVSYEGQRLTQFGTVNTFGVFPSLEGTFEIPQDQDLVFAKLTHQASSEQRLTAKYTLDRRKTRNLGVGGTRALSNGGNDDETRNHALLAHTWVPSSGVVNEVVFGFINRRSKTFRTSNEPERFYPSVTTGGNNDYGADFLERKWNVREDLTVNWGSGEHTAKFGYEWVKATDTGPYPLFLPGAFFYATDDAPIPDFGLVANGVFDEGNAIGNHGFYAQDEWRVTPRVTLNLGVRYDFQTNAVNEDETLPVSDRLGRPRPEPDRNNVAPRFSFAWDVTGTGRSVIRGGWGLYYDQILGNIPFLEILSNSATSVYFVIAPENLTDPINSSVFAADTGPTPTLDVLSPELETPYANMQSLSWSQLVTDRLAFEASYVHVLGLREWFNRPINFNPGGAPPFPDFGRIREFGNFGRSNYHAVQLGLTLRGSEEHGGSVFYTWADATNYADDFRRQPPSDPFDAEAEKGRSGTVAKHRFVANGFVRLPLDVVLSGILTARSGQPYNAILGEDANGDGFSQDRPAGLPRNSGDGPSFVSLDLRLAKAIRLGDGVELQILAEAFNVTNRVNLADPIRVLSSPNVGEFTEALDPRQVQLGARLRF